MGQGMSAEKLAFVRIEPSDDGFTASVTVDGLFVLKRDPETVLRRAAEIYQGHIKAMRDVVSEIESLRRSHRLVPARRIWELGDGVFRLRSALEKLSLEVDDLYGHLLRDLGVKRKWLEKVIILRRHVPNRKMIPAALNWGRCEKGTRRVAEELVASYRAQRSGKSARRWFG